MTVPREPWKLDVIDRHCGLVDLLIGLSTGALVLPVLFLRSFLGVADGKALSPFLTASAYWALSSFCVSILCGLAYRYAATKWIKDAWGQPVKLKSNIIETILDFAFWLMVAAFIVGMACFLTFAATAKAS